MSQQQSWRHPKALYLLCTVVFWERYGFYSIRDLLILFMTKQLGFPDAQAYLVFAASSAMTYLMPLFGGMLSDRWLGRKRGVLVGAALLMFAYILFAFPGTDYFYWGLSSMICGAGFFVPNMVGTVGRLYEADDKRRDSAFSIYYVGINLGATMSPLMASWVIHTLGWHSVYMFAAAALFIVFMLYYFGTKHFVNMPNTSLFLKARKRFGLLHYLILLVGVVASVALLAYLIPHATSVNTLFIVVSLAFLVYVVIQGKRYDERTQKRLWVCLGLTLFSAIFWVLYEQGIMSLVLYTDRNVDRYFTFFGWSKEIPTVWFQSLNSIFVIAIGPVLARVWIAMEKRNLSFHNASKFAWATVIIGVAFLVFPMAARYFSHGGQIAYGWIVLSYFLQTVGEMLLSPIGMAMVTELAPHNMVGVMTGIWYMASASADVIGGYVSRWTTLPSGVKDPVATQPLYSHVFGNLGWVAIVAGLLLLLFASRIERIAD